MTVICLIAGILIGLISSLIPGVNLVLIFAGLLLVWGSNLYTAVVVATASGVTIFMKCLSKIYNPFADYSRVYKLDPVQQMVIKGEAKKALDLSVLATQYAVKFTLISGLVIGLLIVSVGATRFKGFTSYISLLLICIWFTQTIDTSKNKGATCVCLILTSWYGYTAFRSNGLVGNPQTLPAVLLGLLGIPLLVAGWKYSDLSIELKPVVWKHGEYINVGNMVLGTVLGAVTGLAAGIGASSVVSLTEESIETTEDYVLVSTSAEASNDILALILAMLVGISRSGEASMLTSLDWASNTCVAIGLLSGLYTGYTVVKSDLVYHYHKVIKHVPVRLCGVVSIIGSTILCFSSGHGLWLVIAMGCAISLLNRALRVSNQVMFASLAGPVLIGATTSALF